MAELLERLRSALSHRYDIQRELGQGGMAVVFLARDLKLGRDVALKILRPELAASLGVERFLREIEIAAQLTHPNILALHDCGEADGILYYVMPYVKGESLRGRLDREKQLTVDEALQITREVADALGHAHSLGIVHRDVKPENILLEAGHAVVSDFGIAKAITEAGGEHLTETGISIGTPAYMSPEQASAERKLDGRSDIYSLGCVLYEMLAGEPPFGGPSAQAIVAKKLSESVPRVSVVREMVPESVDSALAKALSKTPADRHRTVEQFIDELNTALKRGARETKRPRTRAAVALIATASTAIVVGVVWSAWTMMSSGEDLTIAAENRVIVLPYDNETGDPSLDPIGRMAAEWITEGLAQTGEVQVVPNLIVMQTLAQPETEPEGAQSLQGVARTLASGIAVAGSYYRNGDSLEFHSTVLDVSSGVPLGVVPPTRGAAEDPMLAIDVVRDRVMGVLATRLDPLVRWEIPPAARPPSYDASQAYAQGMEVFVLGQHVAGAEWFERAYALDTTYLRALVMATGAWGFAGRPDKRDSLFQIIAPRRMELAPYDRLRVDLMAAEQRGDRGAALEASRRAAELVPIGTQRWVLVWNLAGDRRPREALEDLESVLEPMRAALGDWYGLWQLHATLYHLLGEHERELDAARAGRVRLPTSIRVAGYEGEALAALGRVDEVMELAGKILPMRTQSGITPANVLLGIAHELRAHGQREAAYVLVDSALAWLDGQDSGWRSSDVATLLRGRLLYARERWGAADSVFTALADDSSRVVDYLGFRGVVAARLADWETARANAVALANLNRAYPFEYGSITVWRANIAALLGDQEEAVLLLHRAMDQGVDWGMWLHRDMDLESLRGYPPFDELLRPRG